MPDNQKSLTSFVIGLLGGFVIFFLNTDENNELRFLYILTVSVLVVGIIIERSTRWYSNSNPDPEIGALEIFFAIFINFILGLIFTAILVAIHTNERISAENLFVAAVLFLATTLLTSETMRSVGKRKNNE